VVDLVAVTDLVTLDRLVLKRDQLGQPERLLGARPCLVINLVNVNDLVTKETDLSVEWWTWSTWRPT
jgi:hypothetical protein